MKTTYLSAAATAKLVRAQLKRHFPNTTFAVRSRTYAGGASINVNWQDGPPESLVKPVVGQFQGGGFDASIDLKYNNNHWLLADGTATLASTPGTSGSGGYIEPEREWMPTPDAKLVSFGADYVFINRQMTPAFAARALAAVQRRFGNLDLKVVVSTFDGSACITGDYNDERRAHETIRKFMSVSGAAA